MLIPNGPFPVPIKSEEGWREAYAWYFYDESTQKMVISPDTASTGIQSMIKDLEYFDVPKVIVGFSQGGFLAPYLANLLNNVIGIVGIGTGFRLDFYEPLLARHPGGLSVHALQGTDDEVFSVDRAEAAHLAVTKLGFAGSFTKIANGTHMASAAFGVQLKNIICSYQSRFT